MHTPGPWFAFAADYQGTRDEAPIFVIGPEEYHTVAQVRAGNTDDKLPEQTPANAKLVAASPDLLAACKALRKAIGEYNPYWDKMLFDALSETDEAIARAEGRE